MTEKDAVFGELAMLLGGNIVRVVKSFDGDETFYGLMIEIRNEHNRITNTKVIWLLSDFEGNAPGGFSIEEQK